MPERLSSQDVSFLYLERPESALHVGSVMVFRPGRDGVDIERIRAHVAARISFVPRYRQRIRHVPGGLANPVWVDDERFDLNHHVRRSALPRPGGDAQLAELVARLQSRPLDRRRPLWELVVVEGLSDGRFAVITKVHQALVDGVRTVDLAHVVLDDSASVPDPPPAAWSPAPEPSPLELLAGAVAESVLRPQVALGAVRTGLGDVRQTAERTARSVGGLLRTARTAAGGAAQGPLTRAATGHRRFAMLTTDLDDYRAVRNAVNRGLTVQRAAFPGLTSTAAPDDDTGAADGPAERGGRNGGRREGRGRRDDRRRGGGAAPPGVSATVNDVVLAALAGGLRAWLLTRGEPVPPGSIVRTLVPVSVRADEGEDAGPLDSRVASLLVDLPTGEPNPIVRLHQIAYQTRAHRETGVGIAAPALAGLTGFAAPTLHSLGARLATGLSRRMFHLVVTNVPGPQQPLYLQGARMLSTFPVAPLPRGQVLGVGLTSYDGKVFYGLNADRDALPDVDVVGQCLSDAVTELMEAIR